MSDSEVDRGPWPPCPIFIACPLRMSCVPSGTRECQPGVMDLEQVPNNLGTACLRLDTGAPITVSVGVYCVFCGFARVQPMHHAMGELGSISLSLRCGDRDGWCHCFCAMTFRVPARWILRLEQEPHKLCITFCWSVPFVVYRPLK